MSTIGITGGQGFIGRSLAAYLQENTDFKVVVSSRECFSHPDELLTFTAACDTIVHLAGLSRHPDPQLLYDTNTGLLRQLLDAAGRQTRPPRIIFCSTTHEERGNPYHRSKRDGRLMVDSWAAAYRNNSCSILIPNTFGPGSRPFFNSFVSTFCYQVARGETPTIIEDAKVELIYINDLCHELVKVISDPSLPNPYTPPASVTTTVSVSEVLGLLQEFRDGITPCGQGFPAKLYSTFISNLPESSQNHHSRR